MFSLGIAPISHQKKVANMELGVEHYHVFSDSFLTKLSRIIGVLRVPLNANL